MEMILWGFVFVVLGIITVLLIATTVFLIRIMNDITKDMPKADVPNPVKAVKEHKAKKVAKKELDMVETILANISNYDGTENNQIDVPRG
jgi:Na+-transporting methylmalonyl-CoA/oxaloacetate decarboxylase gamma subunit